MRKGKGHKTQTYPGKIRYFVGKYAVKELEEEEWASCKKLYKTAESRGGVRGYEALEDGTTFKKGEKVRLPAGLVFPRRG